MSLSGRERAEGFLGYGYNTKYRKYIGTNSQHDLLPESQSFSTWRPDHKPTR